MKKNFIKLQATSTKEKLLLSNVINEVSKDEMNKRSEFQLNEVRNNEIDNSETLENNTNIYSDYDNFDVIPLMNHIKVETTFVSNFGNFLWNVPKNNFRKSPLRRIRRDDKEFAKIDEQFEIEFVCEEVVLTKQEILELFEQWFFNSDSTHNFYSKKKIIDISFNVHKDSSLTYSELLFSLINTTDFVYWGLRKDLITYPTKSERKHFPYDLEKSFKLAYKRQDYIIDGSEEDDSDFIDELLAA